jgi:glycosyltransferase involved in cell wall biosynthesis
MRDSLLPPLVGSLLETRLMNILVVVPWDQEFGGVASVVRNLGRRLESDHHRVVFLHPGPSERLRPRTTKSGFMGYELNLRAAFSRGSPIRSTIAFTAYLPMALYQLASVIRTHDINIVNVHYPIEAFVYFGILRCLLPIKLAVSVHGADLFPDGRPMQRYPWSLRFLIARADALIAPSAAFLRDCLALFPKATSRAISVQNGVDLDELRPGAEGEAPKEKQRYLLCIAAHNEKKAVDVLLEAFAQVSAAHSDLQLVLVGDGPLRGQHEAQARGLNLQERVTFLGFQGRGEVVRLLRGCTMLVLPSRSEPFGMVLAEAMACRKAVVATAVGGIPEVIESGKSGLLVGPDDPAALARAVRSLLEDHALRESIAEAGYRRAIARFGSDSLSQRYLQVFSSLLRRERSESRVGDGAFGNDADLSVKKPDTLRCV